MIFIGYDDLVDILFSINLINKNLQFKDMLMDVTIDQLNGLFIFFNVLLVVWCKSQLRNVNSKKVGFLFIFLFYFYNNCIFFKINQYLIISLLD